MNKHEFKTLFENALEVAARNAEQKLVRSVPRTFEIEMHGLSPHVRILAKDDALEQIYLGPDLFYRIIDLAVRRVSDEVSTVFMCISGHPPSPLNETWNQPGGSGPFKQLLAETIEVV